MKRIPYFDNAKAILIFLVIVGHMLTKFIENHHSMASVYLFIYTFHMPVFILISGFFSKKIYQPGYLPKLVKKLIIPYVLLQVIYSFYYYYVFDDSISFSFFIPRWGLWFLISLIFWNVLLYFFGKLKYGLPLAVIVSVLIGYDTNIGEFLSFSRTIFFFPFFLVGYYLKAEHLLKLKSPKNLIIGYTLAIIGFVIIYYFVPIQQHFWLLGKRPYVEMSTLPIEFAWLGRLSSYVIMAIASYVFLTIVPTKQQFFTSIGTVTMPIYLLHMALVRIFYDSPIRTYIDKTHQFWIIVIIALTIMYVLSRPPIVKTVNKFCQVK